MRIVATIQARMGSSRLPGKILEDANGAPMLQRMVERVRRSKHIQDVMVATTTRPEDDKTEAACQAMGVSFYRGSSEDVLARVVEAAQSAKADLIVQLTGDCPVIDPQLMDMVIQYYLDHSFDYVCNFLKRTLPRGTETQVYSLKLLEGVERSTQELAHREHVSLYIYEHPEKYKLGNVEAEPSLSRPDLRLTLDTPEDLALLQAIYKRLYPQKPDFGLADVISFLDKNPEIKFLNAEITQKPVR